MDTNPTLVAVLNGFSVVNGQIVELKNKKKFKVKTGDEGSSDDDSNGDNKKVRFEGPDFTLDVTATDNSGNVGTASDTYIFPSRKDDDDSRSSDDDSGSGHKKKKRK